MFIYTNINETLLTASSLLLAQVTTGGAALTQSCKTGRREKPEMSEEAGENKLRKHRNADEFVARNREIKLKGY